MPPFIELLKSRQITHRLLRHEKPASTCEDAARQRGVPLHEMIKVLVLKDRHGTYCAACLPADRRLDMGKLSGLLGSKRLSMVSPEELQRITGYKAGAVPPLLEGKIAVVFDKSILDKERVNISSGDHAMGVELSTKDLLRLVSPKILEIARE